MVRTHDPSRGAALEPFRPLDREQELSRGRPKRVDCRGSRCAWNDLKTFSTPSVLNVRLDQGASRAGGFAEEDRILSNLIPANGLSASTSDRSEEAECNALSDPGGGCASPTATSLILTRM